MLDVASVTPLSGPDVAAGHALPLALSPVNAPDRENADPGIPFTPPRAASPNAEAQAAKFQLDYAATSARSEASTAVLAAAQSTSAVPSPAQALAQCSRTEKEATSSPSRDFFLGAAPGSPSTPQQTKFSNVRRPLQARAMSVPQPRGPRNHSRLQTWKSSSGSPRNFGGGLPLSGTSTSTPSCTRARTLTAVNGSAPSSLALAMAQNMPENENQVPVHAPSPKCPSDHAPLSPSSPQGNRRARCASTITPRNLQSVAIRGMPPLGPSCPESPGGAIGALDLTSAFSAEKMGASHERNPVIDAADPLSPNKENTRSICFLPKKRAHRIPLVDELRGHGCHVSPSQHYANSYLGPKSSLRSSRPRRTRYRFEAKVTCMPHPFKHGAGEDAHFISQCGSSLGVADGVGGWVDVGVDAGKYSRELMAHASEYVADTGSIDPGRILAEAYKCTKAIGTTTACVLSVKDGIMRASNLGDSGFILLRHDQQRWRVVSKSTEQQHYFNCPLQLGTNSADTPANADLYSAACLPGDLVIVGTDGMFDNLFIGDIAAYLSKDSRSKPGPNLAGNLQSLTHDLAMLAYNTSRDQKAKTPFAKGANKNGYTHQGGKMDDITIVVAVVVAESTDENNSVSPNRRRVRRSNSSMATMDSESGATTDDSIDGYSPEKQLRSYLSGDSMGSIEDMAHDFGLDSMEM